MCSISFLFKTNVLSGAPYTYLSKLAVQYVWKTLLYIKSHRNIIILQPSNETYSIDAEQLIDYGATSYWWNGIYRDRFTLCSKMFLLFVRDASWNPVRDYVHRNGISSCSTLVLCKRNDPRILLHCWKMKKEWRDG